MFFYPLLNVGGKKHFFMIEEYEDRIVIKYARYLLHIDNEEELIFND